MMETYGANPADHDLLKNSFPFAAFNGGWLVLPCKEQKLDSRLTRPVISVMQGIDVWFYSIQLMIETCIEWVSHPAYGHSGNSSLPENEELAIWRKHNPGCPTWMSMKNVGSSRGRTVRLPNMAALFGV